MLTKFITNTGNTDLNKSVIKVVEKEDFWQKAKRSKLKDNPSLSLLAAIALKDTIQKTNEVATDIKDFWKDESSDKNALQLVYDELNSHDALECIWLLARDSDNQKAINIIRKLKEKALYSCEEGTMYIDEFEWLEGNENKEIAKLLIKHGSFEQHKVSMENNSQVYANVFSIFYSLNNKSTNEFIDNEINKITEENWLEIFENKNSSVLLKLLKKGNPTFSDAFENYLKDIIQCKKELSSIFIEELPSLLNKASDIDWLKIKLTETYFNNSTSDCLSDENFEKIESLFSLKNTKIDDMRILEKLYGWIEESHENKINWLIANKREPFKENLNKLNVKISSLLSSPENEANKLAVKVNNHFNLIST